MAGASAWSEAVWRLGGVFLALLGWWVSFDLLRITIGGAPSNPLLAAQCGGAADSPISDCLSVLRSEYARVLGGEARTSADASSSLPWAGLGLAYFAFVGLWLLLVGAPRRGALWRHAPLLVVLLLGAWTSLSLLQIMASVLQRWCVGCVLAHALNAALIVLVAGSLLRARRTGAPSLALLAAALAAALLAGVAHVQAVQQSVALRGLAGLQQAYLAVVDDPSYVRWRYEQQPSVEIAIPGFAARSGPVDAPHQVVAFIDFQCPACRQAHDQLEAVAARYGAQINVAYLHFPQDPACNPAIRIVGHPAACASARAALAAGLVGGNAAAVQMIHTLYERRHLLDTGRFADWAAEVGLDRNAFVVALDCDNVAAQLAADISQGAGLGLKAVPALYVNGRRFDGWRKLENWSIVLGPPPGMGTAPVSESLPESESLPGIESPAEPASAEVQAEPR